MISQPHKVVVQTDNEHQLYQQAMLNHHKFPVGFERKILVTHSANGVNPACGDEIVMQLELADERLQALAFHGDSCAICRASASMLCQHLSDYSIDEALALTNQIIVAVQDNVALIGQLSANFAPLMSVQKFPVRKQCALLPWQTLQKALAR